MALQFPEGRYPNREETRELLRACDDNREHIEQWNEYRHQNDGWIPDLSDENDKAYLSGLTLCYQNDLGEFNGINLSRAILVSANLENATLREAILVRSDFSGANLQRTNLSGSKLWHSTLTRATFWYSNISGANLWKADLREARLWYTDLDGADLIYANLSFTNLTGTNFSNVNVTDITYDRCGLRGNCRGIRVMNCYGNALFKRDTEDQDYIDTLEKQLIQKYQLLDLETKYHHRDFSLLHHWDRFKIPWALRLFRAWGWIDYGRGLMRTAIIAFFIAMLFGLVFLMADMSGHPLLQYNEGTPEWWFTPFYYSIVTYTTLGFGDVTPCTKVGQLIVIFEVIFGYLTLGLLVSILANKVARRS